MKCWNNHFHLFRAKGFLKTDGLLLNCKLKLQLDVESFTVAVSHFKAGYLGIRSFQKKKKKIVNLFHW